LFSIQNQADSMAFSVSATAICKHIALVSL
jgi:hypothetical protein